MNTTHLFWRLFIGNKNWARRRFALHWEPDQLGGVLYAGVTVLGWSLLYSDSWPRSKGAKAAQESGDAD